MKKVLFFISSYLVAVSLSFAENRILAEYESDSDRYEIRHVSEIHSTGMELLKNSESIALDTFLFPLGVYNLPDSVIDGLAESYVDNRIEIEGKDKVARELETFGTLPAELHRAYSRHFQLTQAKFYTEAAVDTLTLTSRFRSLGSVDSEDFEEFYAKRLRPHKLKVMRTLTREPDIHLALALLKSLAVHNHSKHLQQLALLYLGRQSQHFLQSFFQLEEWEQNKVRASLENGIEEKLIGKRYRTVAHEELSKL